MSKTFDSKTLEYEELIATVKPPKAFVVVWLDAFLAEKIPPPKPMLGSWLPCKGLAMVYAKTGVGKSIFCLTVALSVAVGKNCFGWACPEAKRVLYIDGELPHDHLQEVVRRLCCGLEISQEEVPLALLTIDKQPSGMPPRLDDPADQAWIDSFVETHEIDLIVVDNISTLTRSEYGENESQSWEIMQSWALKMRAQGRTVLFVHHAGKSGAQRGTSKREDVLDSTVKLTHLDTGEEGFKIEFDKHRRGKRPENLEVTFEQDEDFLRPIYERMQPDVDQIARMWNDGMSANDIAGETRMSRKTIYRRLNELQESGQLTRGLRHVKG